MRHVVAIFILYIFCVINTANAKLLSDENLLIVTVKLDTMQSDENIEIYQYDGGFVVPLGVISEILEFPIKVDTKTKTAKGWFINEDRTFTIDLNLLEVTLAGKKESFDKNMVSSNNYDIYIDSKLFSQWFPVDLDLDFSLLTLTINPREKLPIQMRLERDEERKNINRMTEKDKIYDIINPPYQPYSYPFMDFELGYDYDSSANTKNTFSYSTLAKGDLGYMSSNMLLVGRTDDSIQTARFSMEKNDYSGNMFGKMHATKFEIGDINGASTELVSTSSQGRGVTISNFDLERPDQFNSTSFIGDSQPGWDVELYRNGVLLDFQTVGSTGRYEFNDIPIFFGNNNFKIVSYGPQGQVKEETKNYTIDSSFLNTGDFKYNVSVDEKSLSLLGVNENNSSINHDYGIRTVADVEYGFNDNLTGSVGFVQTPIDDYTTHNYQTASIRTNLYGLLTAVNTAYDYENEGNAIQTLFDTRINDINIQGEHSLYDSFISEAEQYSAERRESVSELSFDGKLNNLIPSGVSYSLGSKYEQFEQNKTKTTYKNKLSINVLGMGLSNGLNLTEIDADGDKTKTTTGDFTIRGKYNEYNIRASANYDLDPTSEITTIALSLQKMIYEDINARFDLQKDLSTDEQEASYNFSLSKQFEKFRSSLFTRFEDNSSAAAGIQLSFSLGREPRNQKWFVDGQDISSGGAVSARAFIDNNYDGKFDDGDELIPEAGFKSRAGKASLQKDGSSALIKRLEPSVPSNIEIDELTIEDPFLKPVKEGYTIVPRPGVVPEIDFALVTTVDIEGEVHLNDTPLSLMEIELVNKDCKVVATTKSEFDGFYLFEGMLPGEYHLRITHNSLQKHDIMGKVIKHIKIEPNSDVIHKDFILSQENNNSDYDGCKEE